MREMTRLSWSRAPADVRRGPAPGGVTLSFAGVNTIRDGKIARVREYWTREEALEAAGLSE